MFSPAGSRLPWKSLKASKCTSEVDGARSGLSNSTCTVSDKPRAPEISTAPAADVAASGASRTAVALRATSPTRDSWERTESSFSTNGRYGERSHDPPTTTRRPRVGRTNAPDTTDVNPVNAPGPAFTGP